MSEQRLVGPSTRARPKGPSRAEGCNDLALKMRFRPSERIRRRADFQQVYQRGARVQGRLTTLFTLANMLPVGRLGIAATRRLGGAVERNRAKRLIREVFRRHKVAPGFDVVVVPKRELLDASLTAIESEYLSNIERSLRRAEKAGRVPKSG